LSVSDKMIMQFHKNIAQNVQKKRIDKGKSQLDIAYEALNLSNDSFVSKLENCSEGKHFNLEQLYRISIYLECDISDFLKE
jgi:putative transcriptional regulator